MNVLGTLYIIRQQSVHVIVDCYQFSAFVLFILGCTRSLVVISSLLFNVELWLLTDVYWNVCIGGCWQGPVVVCTESGSYHDLLWETVTRTQESLEACSGRWWRVLQVLFPRNSYRPTTWSVSACLTDLSSVVESFVVDWQQWIVMHVMCLVCSIHMVAIATHLENWKTWKSLGIENYKGKGYHCV